MINSFLLGDSVLEHSVRQLGGWTETSGPTARAAQGEAQSLQGKPTQGQRSLGL